MFHGLNNDFLYSAYRIDSSFENGDGKHVDCMGTGFWVNDDKSGLILITNRHVVDIAYRNPDYRGYRLSALQVSGKVKDHSGLPEMDQTWIVPHRRITYSKNIHNDIACLVTSNPQPTLPAPSRVDYWIPRNLFATTHDFASKLVSCDFVAFPGFPEWHDHTQHRPILRTGTIASDPRYDYSRPPDICGECMAFEAFSYGGSSGSPVFAVEKGPKPGLGISFPGYRELNMVGINAGHFWDDKGTHSGISYMYKSSAILDVIDVAAGYEE